MSNGKMIFPRGPSRINVFRHFLICDFFFSSLYFQYEYRFEGRRGRNLYISCHGAEHCSVSSKLPMYPTVPDHQCAKDKNEAIISWKKREKKRRGGRGRRAHTILYRNQRSPIVDKKKNLITPCLIYCKKNKKIKIISRYPRTSIMGL